MSSYKIDASAVYYSGTELIAMAGGETAAALPNAATPAGAADSANETIGAQQAAEAEANGSAVWVIAVILAAVLAGGAYLFIKLRKQVQ